MEEIWDWTGEFPHGKLVSIWLYLGYTCEMESMVELEHNSWANDDPSVRKMQVDDDLDTNLPQTGENEVVGSERLNIVYVSAEVAPWSKTGGLGDVAGSLPVALAHLGHRVMVVTPR